MVARTATGEQARMSVTQASTAGIELLGGHDLVDQSDLVGPGHGHVSARQQEAYGQVMGDLAGQAVDAHGAGDQTTPRFGQSELGVLGGHDDVAGQGQLQATAEGEAVDPGDDRLDDVVPVLEAGDAGQLGRRCRLLLGQGVPHGRGPPQVAPGAERSLAGAGQHRNPEVVVGLETIDGLAERHVSVVVEGVQALRAVYGDAGDVVGDLESNGRHGPVSGLGREAASRSA